jgi:hypothetical protein
LAGLVVRFGDKLRVAENSAMIAKHTYNVITGGVMAPAGDDGGEKLARSLQTRVFELTFALPVLWSARLLV